MTLKDEELFLLDDGADRYILYAPLRKAAVVLNGAAAMAVSEFINGKSSTELSQEDGKVIQRIAESGIFEGEPPKKPILPSVNRFAPGSVTLFLTSRCNLRCIYCYAEAGKRSLDMPWEVAKTAMDFVVENSLSAKRKDFSVAFHGGGEPTLAWDMMRRCTEYALQKGEEHSMKAGIHSATNGLLDDSQRDYILRTFTGINVSFDGLKCVQDRQRPFASGGGSYEAAMKTLKFFNDAKFNFGIRMTVTAYSLPYLAEAVDFLCRELPAIRQIHAEPVWNCGRCRTSGEVPPDDGAYIREFLLAAEIARRYNVNLYYSGARFESLTNRFCAAPGAGFSVMPEGIASSCYEVTEPLDPRAKIFHYGRYDTGRREFVFDEERLRKLTQLTVDNISHCADCFCKWHCAGDCLAKTLKADTPDTHNGSTRCCINRALTKHQIVRTINNAERKNENSACSS